MADTSEKLAALRDIRDTLAVQLRRLEELGETRAAADLSPAVERLNMLLGEEPDQGEIDRISGKYFLGQGS